MSHPKGFVVRTYQGFGKGDHDMVCDTLESALRLFAAIPEKYLPRVLHQGKVLIDRNLHDENLGPVILDSAIADSFQRLLLRNGSENSRLFL